MCNCYVSQNQYTFLWLYESSLYSECDRDATFGNVTTSARETDGSGWTNRGYFSHGWWIHLGYIQANPCATLPQVLTEMIAPSKST